MNEKELQQLRQEYTKHSLSETSVDPNPHKQFERWFSEALDAMAFEANAFHLATVDEAQKPHVRVVLLKGLEGDEFKFYTNYGSDKAKEMASNPHVAMCFFWSELERQVRIEGVVSKLSRSENEAYFKSRPHLSQIGAHASNQSEVVPNRAFLEQKFQDNLARFKEGEVPLPEYWGGYKVRANYFEFWQGRPGRLHDRIAYTQKGNSWEIKRLSP